MSHKNMIENAKEISFDPADWEKELYVTENTIVHEMFIPAGKTALKHVHNYSHVSYLVEGQAWVEVEGQETLYTAPTGIIIDKGKEHAITALNDVVWLCIHGES